MTNEPFGSISGSDEASGPVTWPNTPFADVTDSNGTTVPHDQSIRFTSPDDQPESVPEQAPPPPADSRKLLFVVGGLIGALVLAGGGAFAYFGYYQSPDRIIRTMVARLSTAKTLEYESDIRIQGSTSLPSARSSASASSESPVANTMTSAYTVRLT
jgi:hypothetical protein